MLVISCCGQFGGVAGPVASRVLGLSGCGSWGEVEEFGEYCGGDLCGDLEQCGASPGEGRVLVGVLRAVMLC